VAYKRYQSLEKQFEAYEESYQINDIRFKNGVSNFLNYIPNKNNLDNTRVNLANAKYKYLLRVKAIGLIERSSVTYSSKLIWVHFVAFKLMSFQLKYLFYALLIGFKSCTTEKNMAEVFVISITITIRSKMPN